MLVKGSKEYQVASKLAKKIIAYSQYQRRDSYYKIAFEKLGRFVYELRKTSGFASQVAETIDKQIDEYRDRQLAFISDKQAWILACAAIENGIEWAGITDELYEKENEAETEVEEQEAQVEEQQNEKEDVTYNVGDVVEHSKFGEGTVTEVTEEKITINFEEFTKTLIIKYSNLKLK
ncbi:hypothetical protein CAPN008_01180 [Capnocytophaga canis]|uniref:hypothetical protein n=1 Tax=Capnocytophaga canis TaxID=1848903 RepID=UPI001AC623A0|nr:hypothetical protein [Capnocytophaga canis]GIM60068.1 hypothetical protein CAPN008_01180 [Capnocytophaga canis]